MSWLKKINSDGGFLGLQFILSLFFIFPYFLDSQLLYGEAQFFTSWRLWLEKTGGAWLSLGLGSPTAQGVGNNFPVLYVWSFLEGLGISFQSIQFLWFFILFFFPFFFLYLLSRRVFVLLPWPAFLVSSFYIYNPVFLNYWINVNPWLMPIYYMMPLFWLIIGVNWQDNKKTFAYTLIAFFFSLYIFANPPYLVVFLSSIGIAILFFSLYFDDKILSVFSVKKLIIVCSALFLVAGFIIFSIFLNYRQSITTYESAVNPIDILKSNSEWAQLDKVFIFKQLFFDEKSFSFLHALMNFSPLYVVYSIPITLIFLIPIARRREKSAYLILSFLIAILFFIKGLNQPFASSFQFFFQNIPLFNMFKTAPEKFSPLYIFLVSLCLVFLLRIDSNRVKRIAVSLLLVWIVVLSAPVYLFRLIPDINHLGVKITHFFHEDYIKRTANYINQRKILATAVFLPGSRSYLVHFRPKAGDEYYLGLDPIVNSIKSNTVESFYDSPVSLAVYESFLQGNYQKILPFLNVKYIVLNKNILSGFGFFKSVDGEQYENILGEGLSRTDIDDSVAVYELHSFLPKFYSAKKIILSSERPENLLGVLSAPEVDLRTAVVLEKQNLGNTSIVKAWQGNATKGELMPVIEYKKIAPTKYELRLHKASGVIPIVFTEAFNHFWNLYPEKTESVPDVSKQHLSSYSLIEGNEVDQADREEVRHMLGRGVITSIGTGEAFISKMIEDSIQNDALSSSAFWSAWFQPSLDKEGYQVEVNGYANMWMVNVDVLCASYGSSCTKDTDGTYDINLIVEYWPQRVFYAGVFFSLILVLGAVAYLFFRRLRSEKKSHDKRVDI